MNAHQGFRLGSLLCGVCGCLTLTASLAAGQSPARNPPIHGVTGTIATPESVDEFYAGMKKLRDGIDTLVPDRKPEKVDGESESLDHLRPGTPVVVQYSVKGFQTSASEIQRVNYYGSRVNEGIVTSVDRSNKRITIRYATGDAETLRLKDDPSKGGRAIVHYTDESGRQVAQYFKPKS